MFMVVNTTMKNFKMEISSNGFEGYVSPEAAGIIVVMYALNILISEVEDNEDLIDHYYSLREYALDHGEGVKILRAID